jgi:AcrR family transcriptional regulator
MARPRTTSDEQILAAARACFLEHGAGVATTIIAERLGISHAVLFQRFGTKEQLLRAALLPQFEPPWLEQLRAGPDERDGETQLRDLAEQMFGFFQSLVPGVVVLRSAGLMPPFNPKKAEDLPPIRTRREVKAWFERARARGVVREIDSGHAADLFLGALMYRPFQQHMLQAGHTRAENQSFLDFTVGTVWNAVRPNRSLPRAARVGRTRSK